MYLTTRTIPACVTAIVPSVRTYSTQALGEEAVNLLFEKHRFNRIRGRGGTI
jgi:hypothetical protein